MSLLIYFIAVIGMNQALPSDVVLVGTLATAAVLLWRMVA